MNWKQVPERAFRLRRVEFSDFESGLSIVRSSVSREVVRGYEDWIRRNELRPQRNNEEMGRLKSPFDESPYEARRREHLASLDKCSFEKCHKRVES